MSSKASSASKAQPPAWLWQILGAAPAQEGATLTLGGRAFEMRGGIPRARAALGDAQDQTRGAFAYKWKQRETYDSPASLARARAWLIERYGDVAAAPWLGEHG